MTKREAALAVQAAKARLGVTWAQLAEAAGAPLVWTTAALLGQHPMNVAQAQAAASLLELDQDVAQALQTQPTRGALDAAVPVDPTIYRFYEVLQVYGPTIKELIHEQFGDGIMRAPSTSGSMSSAFQIRLATASWSRSMGSFFPTSGEVALSQAVEDQAAPPFEHPRTGHWLGPVAQVEPRTGTEPRDRHISPTAIASQLGRTPEARLQQLTEGTMRRVCTNDLEVVVN